MCMFVWYIGLWVLYGCETFQNVVCWDEVESTELGLGCTYVCGRLSLM